MKVINTLFFRSTLVLVLVSVYFTIYSKTSSIEIKFSTDAEDLNVLYTSTDIHIFSIVWAIMAELQIRFINIMFV